MKTILKILLIILFFTNVTFAQFPIVRTVSYEQSRLINYDHQKGDYIKDINNQLDPYVGTWKYIGTDKILTLKLTRVNEFLLKAPNNSPNAYYGYFDEIVLTYKLEDNSGNIIFDSTNLPNVTQHTDGYGGFLNGKEDSNYINGVFKDFTKMVSVARCEITKVATPAGQPEKIYFELFENHSMPLINPATGERYVDYIPGQLYSVPNRIELIKQ
ncbi:MAG: hypothetical protein RBR78_11725 [Flavobacteriaceae bacterium]|jgi:hypothetical protein|nr:hypothetical protein [Flavobacteriaceae bacterium]